jgi:hypothetical protein
MTRLLLLSLCCFWVWGNARADQFTDDLADKPGFNTGTNLIQAGVCGLASWGGKALLDEGNRQDVDWAPALTIFLAGCLVHSVYWGEGGKNAKDALAEQEYETGGLLIPFFLN